MKFEPAPIAGAWVIHPQKFSDQRGFFAHVWSRAEFAEQGLETHLELANVAFNPHKGTLRGLHYQLPPYSEVKLIRCTRGSVYDVGVDLRPDSATYLHSFGLELHADEHLQLYLPPGCAHGYLTLTDDCEVAYLVNQIYAPDSGRGLRWNDPQLNIDWPFAPELMHERDALYPDLDPASLPQNWLKAPDAAASS